MSHTVIYTAIYGDGCELHEPSNCEKYDLVCFTDRKDLKSKSWNIVHKDGFSPDSTGSRFKASSVAAFHTLGKDILGLSARHCPCVLISPEVRFLYFPMRLILSYGNEVVIGNSTERLSTSVPSPEVDQLLPDP